VHSTRPGTTDVVTGFAERPGSVRSKAQTLAQVAMHNLEYIRGLVLSAQRPEVRAAAGRLVEALDAAAEHKRRTSRPNRRSRSTA
jgi:hypothetical protein